MGEKVHGQIPMFTCKFVINSSSQKSSSGIGYFPAMHDKHPEKLPQNLAKAVRRYV